MTGVRQPRILPICDERDGYSFSQPPTYWTSTATKLDFSVLEMEAIPLDQILQSKLLQFSRAFNWHSGPRYRSIHWLRLASISR